MIIDQCFLNLHGGTFNGKLLFLCCASDINHESFDQIIFEKALFSLSIVQWLLILRGLRSSPPEVFLRKGVLKICSKFTGEHPCRSVISTKLQSNFIEITVRHVCSPVNLPHIFRAPFPRNAYGGVLLRVICFSVRVHQLKIHVTHQRRRLLMFKKAIHLIFTETYTAFIVW